MRRTSFARLLHHALDEEGLVEEELGPLLHPLRAGLAPRQDIEVLHHRVTRVELQDRLDSPVFWSMSFMIARSSPWIALGGDEAARAVGQAPRDAHVLHQSPSAALTAATAASTDASGSSFFSGSAPRSTSPCITLS